MKRFIIPIFIPHRGCRYNCIFCNQHHITGQYEQNNFIEIQIKEYIETQLKKYSGINKKYEKAQISFYGGSFTCLKKNEMLNYFQKVLPFVKKSQLPIDVKYKLIDSLRLSTRPDCIDDNILKLLKENFVQTIEIGAQCLDNFLLKILNRGHSVENIITAFNLLKKNNFESGIQIMIGVPRETEEILYKTAELIINKIKPNFIRIYPLIVLKGTMLEKIYKKGEYSPLSIEEAVRRASIIAKKCIENNITIIRIGLQYTESLAQNAIAGPLYPNLGELVWQKIKIK